MEAFKALVDFSVEIARGVATFRMLKEFYADCFMFSKEAFQEDRKLGRDDYHLMVVTRYPELDSSFLNKQESKEEVTPSSKLWLVHLRPL